VDAVSVNPQHLRYVHETLDPLIGATVVGVAVEPMGPHDVDAAPVLIFQCPNGQRVHLAAWRDDEGNGGGALVVTKATKPRKTNAAGVSGQKEHP
jgi:hypothetical protein